MKRERMRARGLRGTHTLVAMVREQVMALTETSAETVRIVGKLRQDVETLRDDVVALGQAVLRLDQNVAKLGGMLEVIAEHTDDHETRLIALEGKKGRGR